LVDIGWLLPDEKTDDEAKLLPKTSFVVLNLPYLFNITSVPSW
jgi:hypothetical protein